MESASNGSRQCVEDVLCLAFRLLHLNGYQRIAYNVNHLYNTLIETKQYHLFVVADTKPNCVFCGYQ